MTPDQIKLLVRIGILAAIFLAGATSGWSVNGWRLGEQVERVEGERDLALAQGDVLSEAVRSCSASVDISAKTSAAAISSGNALVAEARRLHGGSLGVASKLDELIAAGQRPPNAGCDDAWDLIEKLSRERR